MSKLSLSRSSVHVVAEYVNFIVSQYIEKGVIVPEHRSAVMLEALRIARKKELVAASAELQLCGVGRDHRGGRGVGSEEMGNLEFNVDLEESIFRLFDLESPIDKDGLPVSGSGAGCMGMMSMDDIMKCLLDDGVLIFTGHSERVRVGHILNKLGLKKTRGHRGCRYYVGISVKDVGKDDGLGFDWGDDDALGDDTT